MVCFMLNKSLGDGYETKKKVQKPHTCLSAGNNLPVTEAVGSICTTTQKSAQFLE